MRISPFAYECTNQHAVGILEQDVGDVLFCMEYLSCHWEKKVSQTWKTEPLPRTRDILISVPGPLSTKWLIQSASVSQKIWSYLPSLHRHTAWWFRQTDRRYGFKYWAKTGTEPKSPTSCKAAEEMRARGRHQHRLPLLVCKSLP